MQLKQYLSIVESLATESLQSILTENAIYLFQKP